MENVKCTYCDKPAEGTTYFGEPICIDCLFDNKEYHEKHKGTMDIPWDPKTGWGKEDK